MNKQQILKQVDELKQKVEELKKKVSSSDFEVIKNSTRSKPTYGEKYFCLFTDGIVRGQTWLDGIDDLFRFNSGNCFETEKEGYDFKENILTKQALKDLALELNDGVEIDWDDRNQKKYCFVYSHNGNKLDYTPNSAWQELGHIYSLDYKFLKIAKDRIGEEKLIKLIKSGV